MRSTRDTAGAVSKLAFFRLGSAEGSGSRRFSVGTRLRNSGNDAELLHHAQGIQENARRLHFAVFKSINDHSHTRTERLVAGIPKNSPWCVPVQINRVRTLLPSAICSSTLHLESGKACRIRLSVSLSPWRPGPFPGNGTSSTTSA